MSRVLLINPAMAEIYKIAKIKNSVPNYFPLNLLTIATPLIENSHEVQLLDLNYKTNVEDVMLPRKKGMLNRNIYFPLKEKLKI